MSNDIGDPTDELEPCTSGFFMYQYISSRIFSPVADRSSSSETVSGLAFRV